MQKSHVLLTLAVAGLAACVVTVSLAIPVHADPDVPEIVKAAVASPPPEPVPQIVVDAVTQPIEVPGDDGRHERLRTYVLDIMNGWSHAVPKLEVADYGDIASDLAFAVLAEPDDGTGCKTVTFKNDSKHCVWADGWNTDGAKVVMLASLGYWEGARYAAYVDDGRCNDKVWRASKEGQQTMRVWGDCDHSQAHSIFQIHPIDDTLSTLYKLCNTKMVDNSRVDAARCALALARGSMVWSGNLSSYTGEWGSQHPKADDRLNFAKQALAKHPMSQ
jgi:hypothetical protein